MLLIKYSIDKCVCVTKREQWAKIKISNRNSSLVYKTFFYSKNKIVQLKPQNDIHLDLYHKKFKYTLTKTHARLISFSYKAHSTPVSLNCCDWLKVQKKGKGRMLEKLMHIPSFRISKSRVRLALIRQWTHTPMLFLFIIISKNEGKNYHSYIFFYCCCPCHPNWPPCTLYTVQWEAVNVRNR